MTVSVTSYHLPTFVSSTLLLFHFSARRSPSVSVGTLRRVPYSHYRPIYIFLIWVAYGGYGSFVFTCKYGWIFLAYRRPGINLYILCGFIVSSRLVIIGRFKFLKIYLGFFFNADFGLMIYILRYSLNTALLVFVWVFIFLFLVADKTNEE